MNYKDVENPARDDPLMGILRIAVQSGLLVASGWLLNETAVPLWQIGLALILAAAAVAWMYLHEA